MDVSDLLIELFERIPPLAGDAIDGLSAADLVARPGPEANTIGWLAWHIGRVQDAQISDITGDDQLWATGGWAAGFGLEPDPSNSGYGHTAEDVARICPKSPDVLTHYLAAAHDRTVSFLRGTRPADLDRVIDRRWDPPVTLGVRLVSIADDCLQHAGQAAYVRGLLGK
ncbi:MAG TPA: DinB family protein [Acidimicrobiales bacterium]|jgi:hypothetical protein|nr:DinB family protein [Acidimicrobiales bacterium]